MSDSTQLCKHDQMTKTKKTFYLNKQTRMEDQSVFQKSQNHEQRMTLRAMRQKGEKHNIIYQEQQGQILYMGKYTTGYKHLTQNLRSLYSELNERMDLRCRHLESKQMLMQLTGSERGSGRH